MKSATKMPMFREIVRALKRTKKLLRNPQFSTDNNLLDGGRVGCEVGVGSVMGGPTKKSEQKYKNAIRL